jgi:crotonobetainyl-CoA:carnitine CoA-transferase CaiB-like acyl-CoA transferase
MKIPKSIKDLKVIELSTVLAGPSVGMFFAELGSTVIKVEHPSNPDVTRSWKLPAETPESSISAYFSSVNYGKSYVSLNLLDTADAKKMKDLIRDADVLLMNFKRGDDRKFQLETKTLHAINPRLIIGKISGFGDESDRVAYDLILQAETGFMSMNGTAESGPVKMPVALIDVLAGHQLKEGILLALMERHISGIGSEVSVSLFDAAVCSLANQASNYLMTGHIAQRMGSLHPNIAPYGELFETKDAATITFAIGSDLHFKKLLGVLGMTELAEDKRFKYNQNRLEFRNELFLLLKAQVSLFLCDTLLDELHALHVPCAKVKSIDEVLSSKEAKSLILKEEISGYQTARVRTSAFKFSHD